MRRGTAGQAHRWLQRGFVDLISLVVLLPMAAQLAGFNAWREGENRAQAPLPAMPQDLVSLRG